MRKAIILSMGVAALLSASSCGKHQQTQSPQEMVVDVAFPIVDTVILHKTYPGTLTAKREVALVARVNGYQVSTNYTSGDYVEEGQILFRLEDRNYRDAVEQAEAQLATAKSNFAYAESRYTAMKEAYAGDAVSEIEVEQAKDNLEQARAAIKSAEATLQTARTKLSYCTVRAPFAGHMSGTVFNDGAYVSGEGSPVTLATIYEDNMMTVNFFVEDATYLAAFRRSIIDHTIDYNAIPLKFSEDMSHDYTAQLTYQAPDIDTSTGTMKFEARVENPYGELRSGMYVMVDMPFGKVDDAILVRDSSVGSDQLGKYVYVVNDSNKVVYTPVEVGSLYNDSLRIVTKGLGHDDRYVTRALLKVRNGMVVKPNLVK